ncbi:MucBP domain-containing protein [Cellulomonas edaphi]|uniref:MucBP domain-containing protein n=1 Tax=Cellulomonas edaphi TaxID=3053468 RepID=A0ABT7S3T6_9CELL|nr:MucBP domain-containing protein [Cellulomons edaphi]MDM7830280.1 MucBP domain-containing protein [Cellulomons edaphi]
MSTTRRAAGRTAALAVSTSLALVLVGAGTAFATPGHPGTPDDPTVVFHENFENANHSGLRTELADYRGTGGQSYTADAYWLNAVKANGLVLSWDNTRAASDATGANNGTEVTAFNTLRQLTEALGKVNGTSNPQQNMAISAYTQSTGAVPAGGKIMFATKDDISLKDSKGRFLAFSLAAAATNAKNAAHPDRVNPQLTFAVAQNGVERALTTKAIDPITDPRGHVVPVTSLAKGAAEPVYAGSFASDQSFLYDGGQFGIVIRNLTSAYLGNDGAFDDIKVLDVTPQLDKSFSTSAATTGDTVRLTLTVTNTAEKAEKKGWSFTDSLPAGLVIADEPKLVASCDASKVSAPAGGTEIAVAEGSLDAGQTSCTVSVDVTAAQPGTYTNGAANITVRRGLDAPDAATVTFTDAAAGDLVVRYVDEHGKQLAPSDTSSGKPGDTYTTSAKRIDGYELVAEPANAAGELTDGSTTVTYVYRPIPAPATGELVVRYVDENGKQLAPSDSSSGKVGDDYSTRAKDIDGYVLSKVTGDESGQLVDGTTEVVYVYAPAPVAEGSLVVSYVDEHGAPLSPSDTSTGTPGDAYTTHAKDIDGYELVATPANASGELTDGTTQVVYVYKPVPAPAKADLVVRYVDEKGKALAPSDTSTGTPGDDYTTHAKTVPGYELVRVPANASGSLADGTTTVTYVYKPVVAPKPADVTVRYVDEKGKPLADPTSSTGTQGEHYTTSPKSIDGYELVAVPANANGTYTDDTPDVVYVYRPIVVEPTPTPEPTRTPVKPTPEPTKPVSGRGASTRPTTPVASSPVASRPVVVAKPSGHLAQTGSDAGRLVALGSALVLGGATLAAARRRSAAD